VIVCHESDGGAVKARQKVRPESLCSALIAPCGMNCGLCSGHLRVKNQCAGCNGDDSSKPRYCLTCKIKTCDEIASGARSFCFSCSRFPCTRLRQLDKRYRTKYGMSMLENLHHIQEAGLEAFVAAEQLTWACPACGGLLCVHHVDCAHCGRTWNHSPAAK
jgi:hypothetical protein